jgi:hypothetical protein
MEKFLKSRLIQQAGFLLRSNFLSTKVEAAVPTETWVPTEYVQ